jgi:hypothetical protein
LLPTLLDGQNEITNSIIVLSPKANMAMSHYIYLFKNLGHNIKGLLDANKNGH